MKPSETSPPSSPQEASLSLFSSEMNYWVREFPTLTREEIADLLEAAELDQLNYKNDKTTSPDK